MAAEEGDSEGRKIPEKHDSPMPLWQQDADSEGRKIPDKHDRQMPRGGKMPAGGRVQVEEKSQVRSGQFQTHFPNFLDLTAELGEILRGESPATNVIGLCRAVVRCRRE